MKRNKILIAVLFASLFSNTMEQVIVHDTQSKIRKFLTDPTQMDTAGSFYNTLRKLKKEVLGGFSKVERKQAQKEFARSTGLRLPRVIIDSINGYSAIDLHQQTGFVVYGSSKLEGVSNGNYLKWRDPQGDLYNSILLEPAVNGVAVNSKWYCCNYLR